MVNRLARPARVPIAGRFAGAGDQVALPVPRYGPAGRLGGPLTDHRHACQRAGPAGVRATVRLAATSASPEHPGQVYAVDRLVNGLVHEVPPGIVRELAAQRMADLFRAPPLLQPAGHELAQYRIAHQLAAAGPPPPLGRQPLRGERPVLPLSGSRLRRSSRLTADGLRSSCPAMARTPSPARRRSAMRTRSSSDRYRSEICRFRALITGG
jgi:hypothetical protein